MVWKILLQALNLFKLQCIFLTSLCQNKMCINLVKDVDTSKACGHDGVGNKIIQICCEGLCDSFTSLINSSFRLGEFPFQWKLANVIPLFKKDNRHLMTNYRPVLL